MSLIILVKHTDLIDHLWSFGYFVYFFSIIIYNFASAYEMSYKTAEQNAIVDDDNNDDDYMSHLHNTTCPEQLPGRDDFVAAYMSIYHFHRNIFT